MFYSDFQQPKKLSKAFHSIPAYEKSKSPCQQQSKMPCSNPHTPPVLHLQHPFLIFICK